MWQPITDLPANWREYTDSGLHALADVWQEQRQWLEETQTYQQFNEQMRRRIAIETGVIERLYTIDRGVTYLLIERGIDESLIPHGSTDIPAAQVVAHIRDQAAAVEQVFHYVGAQRDLSTSFIKQLHQLLTRNQDYTEGRDQFGQWGRFALLKGDWKRTPNNPTLQDGRVHEYAPTEHIASEMDRLIGWHLQHMAEGVSPEIEAAWLHHRFTQIHPFQDGNGRVARLLATLVFLRARWFPLVVLGNGDENRARNQYLDALQEADAGDISWLVRVFAKAQRRAFIATLSLSENVLAESGNYTTALSALVNTATQLHTQSQMETPQFSRVEKHARMLLDMANQRLSTVSGDISRQMQAAGINVQSWVSRAETPDEKAGYYLYQINRAAQIQEYSANLSGYKAWTRLALRFDIAQLELLISLHGLGYDNNGVMIGSAIAWKRLLAEESEERLAQQITALSTEPFSFTYLEDANEVRRRFNKWLEDAIVVGIDYIRRNL